MSCVELNSNTSSYRDIKYIIQLRIFTQNTQKKKIIRRRKKGVECQLFHSRQYSVNKLYILDATTVSVMILDFVLDVKHFC